MLTESEFAILKGLVESSTQTVHVAHSTAFVGEQEVPLSAIRKLLSVAAIREIGTEVGITSYELTATGKLIHKRPEMAEQVGHTMIDMQQGF